MIKPGGGGGFQPSDIAGLKLWLKADSLALADGNPVSTWTDSSGNGNDATGSSTARPTYKTAIVGGKPVVRFDGSNDVLATSFVTPSAHTIFVVYNRTNLSPIGSGPGGDGPLWRGTNVWPSISSGFATLSTTIYTGAWSYLALTWNGTSTSTGAWLNGADVFTLSSFPVAATDPLQLGSSLDGFYSGDIAEVCVFDSLLNTTDRQLVENYFHTKYGI